MWAGRGTTPGRRAGHDAGAPQPGPLTSGPSGPRSSACGSAWCHGTPPQSGASSCCAPRPLPPFRAAPAASGERRRCATASRRVTVRGTRGASSKERALALRCATWHGTSHACMGMRRRPMQPQPVCPEPGSQPLTSTWSLLSLLPNCFCSAQLGLPGGQCHHISGRAASCPSSWGYSLRSSLAGWPMSPQVMICMGTASGQAASGQCTPDRRRAHHNESLS